MSPIAERLAGGGRVEPQLGGSTEVDVGGPREGFVGLGDRRPVGHERSCAAAADEPAFLFERAVGTGDGVRREVHVPGGRPHRREPVAGKERPSLDLTLDAVAQLFVGRAVAVADPHPQARRRCTRSHRGEYHTRLRYGSPMRIRIVPGGPMLVDGVPLSLLEHGDRGFSLVPLDTEASYALCRCGRSREMPLCDKPAPYACFEEEPHDGVEPGPFLWDVPDPAGPPAIALKPNGPIRVTGDVEMTYGEAPLGGRDRWSVCRCGASRCQPVCDSSHKVIGFRT